MRAALIVATACSLTACGGHRPLAAPREASRPTSGARSPAGDRHPGQIAFEDQVAKRSWSEPVELVPQAVAWARSASGAWIPVVKIRSVGTVERREITRLGPGDQLIDTTVQAPPR